MLLTGKTISHYKILERLGGGGMGEVYKAQDLKLGRFVAIKLLPADLTRDEEAKARFIKEARAASALQHHNICTIHEIDETEDGRLFLCMDCYEGETLKDRIGRGALSVEDALDIAVQAADGLTKAHDGGIIHRDIKPANLFITTEGMVKILDFGLAKLSGQTTLTKEGSTMGTVAYMSPEQTRGEGVDTRTDIWSLGVVLYEMLTGQRPFRGDYDQAVVYSIVNEEPEPLRSLKEGMPEGLASIVAQALEKDPRRRPCGMAEAAAGLKACRELLNGGKLERSRKMIEKSLERRRFRRFVLILGTLLALAAVFVVLMKAHRLPGWLSPRKSILVSAFENMTSDPEQDRLCSILPNLLITSLERCEKLDVWTWERAGFRLQADELNDKRALSPDLALEFCRKYGIEMCISGHFIISGDQLSISIELKDVEGKDRFRSVEAKGVLPAEVPGLMIDEASREILSSLHLPEKKVKGRPPESIVAMTTRSLDAYWKYLSGTESFYQEKYEESVPFFKDAVRLDTAFASAHLYLARSYTRLKKPVERRESLIKAYTHREGADEKNRKYIDADYAFYLNKSWDEANRILRQLLTQYPYEKEALSDLAFNYRYTNPLNSVREYQKVIEVCPYDRDALEALCGIYAEAGDFTQAENMIYLYRNTYSEDVHPVEVLGDMYLQKGRPTEAYLKYSDTQLGRFSPLSFWKAGYCLALREDYRTAGSWFDRYMNAKIPIEQKIYASIWDGLYQAFLGDSAKALSILEDAVSLSQRMNYLTSESDAALVRGCILYDREQYESSMKSFEEYHRLSRKIDLDATPQGFTAADAEYDFWSGMILARQGAIDSANAKMKKLETFVSANEAIQGSQWISAKWQYDLAVLQIELHLSQKLYAKAVRLASRLPVWGIPPAPIGIKPLSMAKYHLPMQNDQLARALAEKGELKRASEEYSRLLDLEKKGGTGRVIHPIVHYRLARVLDRRGLPSDARVQYKAFLELWGEKNGDSPEVNSAKFRLSQL